MIPLGDIMATTVGKYTFRFVLLFAFRVFIHFVFAICMRIAANAGFMLENVLMHSNTELFIAYVLVLLEFLIIWCTLWFMEMVGVNMALRNTLLPVNDVDHVCSLTDIFVGMNVFSDVWFLTQTIRCNKMSYINQITWFKPLGDNLRLQFFRIWAGHSASLSRAWVQCWLKWSLC